MRFVATQLIAIAKGTISSPIYLSGNSGKIIYRNKIDTLIGILHPGIILGDDMWGTTWVIHNHYLDKTVQIVSIQDFAEGAEVFYDSRKIFYSTTEVIRRAIQDYTEGREYSWLFNNCQHFINRIVQNKHYSETIDSVTGNAVIAGSITALVGLLIDNKPCFNTGLAIMSVGGLANGISRYRAN